MRKLRKKITAIVEKTETGYSAYAKEYNVFTTGRNIYELTNNMVEAMNLYLEDSGLMVSDKNIDLRFDLKLFFNHYRVINSKFLAERIGMNESLLSQYINGKKNPSSKQANRIMDGVHEVGNELADVNFV